MKTVRTESPVDVEPLTVRGALAVVVMLALAGATSCTTKPFVTKSERNDSAIVPPVRLRLRDQRLRRYDGKSLRNYTAEDGLTSKDIMGIYTDRHGDLWLAGNGVFKLNGTSFDRIF